MKTVHYNCLILAFDIFVMTLIEIGPLFVLFLDFLESFWCFIGYLPRFSCTCFLFVFFASQENSPIHAPLF